MKSYHNIDSRWSVFGINNFEQFIDKYVVKGRFHSSVPQDIKESYKTVEYLMTFAWYHYPLYDEAVNKLLLIFEMAIKQKCEILGITIVKSKNGFKNEIKLSELIQSICKIEKEKNQKIFLDHLRTLRNTQVHQSKHSYAGGIWRNKVVFTVNIINELFATESIINKLDKLNTEFSGLLQAFQNKTLIYEHNSARIIIHNIGLVDLFESDASIVFLLYLEPVCVYGEDQMNKKVWPKPIFIDIQNLTITENAIYGIDGLGLKHKITLNNKEENELTAVNFKSYLMSLNTRIGPAVVSSYLSNRFHLISEMSQDFRYKHYINLI